MRHHQETTGEAPTTTPQHITTDLLHDLIEATQRQQRPSLTIQDKLSLAEAMGKARVFPGVENQYQAMAAIEIGQALGMEPGEALMAIHFGAQGKPAISVHWQAAKLQRLGWRWSFLEHTSHTCRMRFFPPAAHPAEPFDVQFTMAEAQAIKVYDKEQGGKGASLAGKWNYQSWGEDMLYAYCMRRVVRRYEPRVLGGFTPDDEAHEAEARPGAPVTPDAARQAVADVWGDTLAHTHQDAQEPHATPDTTPESSQAATADPDATPAATGPTMTPEQATAWDYITQQCTTLGMSPGQALEWWNREQGTAYGLPAEMPVGVMRRLYQALKKDGPAIREACTRPAAPRPSTLQPFTTQGDPVQQPAAEGRLV